MNACCKQAVHEYKEEQIELEKARQRVREDEANDRKLANRKSNFWIYGLCGIVLAVCISTLAYLGLSTNSTLIPFSMMAVVILVLAFVDFCEFKKLKLQMSRDAGIDPQSQS